ncbi:sensor histidine kinase [Streptomyces coeruleoprunus]|uniref:histidine kinase n=1 Tax=Streptomyces coeruleoprunus TaxID=285563 RepID=A0ABV9XQT1_9ACTN
MRHRERVGERDSDLDADRDGDLDGDLDRGGHRCGDACGDRHGGRGGEAAADRLRGRFRDWCRGAIRSPYRRLLLRCRPTAERAVVVVAVTELLTVADAFSTLPFAVCAVALLALPLRRRFPMLTLCATLPSILTGHLWLPPMIAMFHVSARQSRARIAVGCVLLFASALCPWPLTEFADMSRQELFTSIEAAGLLSVGPTALGLLASTRAELRARLADLTATQERERRLESERAVARERARLAREMHDTVSHHVGIIAVQSGALRAGETDEWKRETAESIRRHSVQALEELRDMVGVLRGSDVDAAAAAGRTGLDRLRELTADSLLDVTVELPERRDEAWGPAVEAAVFRIVQEALNNVRRHAPGSRVAVAVAPGEGSLTVEVRNGPSAEACSDSLPSGGGHGLAGLRERAELLGGRLSAGPCPEGGFMVRAVLPL